jgi:hypothetical protein
MSYNSVGAGVTPRLGQGKPNGLARPGKSISGGGAGPKAARPGGVTKAPKGGGSGSVARPGGNQRIGR